MSDRIDPPTGDFEQGPWPQVSDLSRLYDHGQPWCVNAPAHPDRDGGYPDPERHLPWHECHSDAAFVDGVRRDLAGEPVGVSVYNAAPFRFGELRDDEPPAVPRVVLETWTSDVAPSHRVSLTAGEALRLARILMRCADELTFVQRAA
jgi:hypothetical protein